MTDRTLSRAPAGARQRPIPPQQARTSPRQPAQPKQAPHPEAVRARLRTYFARPFAASSEVLFSAAVIVALFYSWLNRHEGHLTPEKGAGYWLGIAGSVMMAVLLLYPLRKRLGASSSWGSTAFWFRWHMILGVIGPALVMVHSNWVLQSINATVATLSMLIVAFSGIVGRYLYNMVHLGLYGRKADVRQFLTGTSYLKELLGGDLPQTEQLFKELQGFEARVLAPRRGFLSQTAAFFAFGIRRAIFRRRVMRLVNEMIASEAKRQNWDRATGRKRRRQVREHLRLYFTAITRAVRFGVFERLFSAWHVLHMPLFFLLVAATIVHIIAVHRY